MTRTSSETEPYVCPKSILNDPQPCAVSEVATGAEYVRYLDQCTRCGWVDPVSLDRWAEHGIKSRMDKSAQAVALAAEGEPFTFVQFTGEPLTLESGLAQALGAASMCWVKREDLGEFDPSRAKEIYEQLRKLVGEFMKAGEDKAALAGRREGLDGAYLRVREYLEDLVPMDGNDMVAVDRKRLLEFI